MMIEVRLNLKDMPRLSEPKEYFDFIEEKLKAAGVPVDGDNLLHGTLHRFDDPEDFGGVIYRWEQDA